MKIAELDKLATDLKFPVKREKKELTIDRIVQCYGETCNRILELSPVAAFFNKSFSKGTPLMFLQGTIRFGEQILIQYNIELYENIMEIKYQHISLKTVDEQKKFLITLNQIQRISVLISRVL